MDDNLDNFNDLVKNDIDFQDECLSSCSGSDESIEVDDNHETQLIHELTMD